MDPANSPDILFEPFAGDSEMAGRMRCHPWERTALGPVASWSHGLRNALGLSLRSRLCNCIYWGEEHNVLYNDAYSAILGTKHPWALAQPASRVWPEIYDIIGPLLNKTFHIGVTTGDDDAPIFINRSGYVEEFYCSYSYTPLVNEYGRIEGVFATLPETSIRVIGERRLHTLQHLGSKAREARTPDHTLQIAAEVIAENPHDIPFAAMYLWDAQGLEAQLCAAANVTLITPAVPPVIRLQDDSPLSRLARRALARRIESMQVSQELTPLPTGAWPVPPREILVLPLHSYGSDAPDAFMLAGVNPYKRLDERNFAFFQMVADQITRSLAEAYNHEQEDARVKAMQARAQVAQQEERVRIAREVHDTLLQSVQGMHYLLEAGLEKFKTDEDAAARLFEKALTASGHAINEGREVLSLLRSSSPANNNLAVAFKSLGKELVNDALQAYSLDICGRERELIPRVLNELYAVCREAVTNAVRHANAQTVTVRLSYADDLALSIVDDGCGMSDALIATGRAGHFGLQGMRERAMSIGGWLAIESAAQGGTAVRLTLPGAAAYADPAAD